ncbi:hypothetical protein [Cupriavidus sp. Agwp_2]|uniref:hypothetical protein n=1 Tax=Cupriavidus sp. Agwp_2 TaxID=2897324 RepID=UPI0034606588
MNHQLCTWQQYLPPEQILARCQQNHIRQMAVLSTKSFNPGKYDSPVKHADLGESVPSLKTKTPAGSHPRGFLL